MQFDIIYYLVWVNLATILVPNRAMKRRAHAAWVTINLLCNTVQFRSCQILTCSPILEIQTIQSLTKVFQKDGQLGSSSMVISGRRRSEKIYQLIMWLTLVLLCNLQQTEFCANVSLLYKTDELLFSEAMTMSNRFLTKRYKCENQTTDVFFLKLSLKKTNPLKNQWS